MKTVYLILLALCLHAYCLNAQETKNQVPTKEQILKKYYAATGLDKYINKLPQSYYVDSKMTTFDNGKPQFIFLMRTITYPSENIYLLKGCMSNPISDYYSSTYTFITGDKGFVIDATSDMVITSKPEEVKSTLEINSNDYFKYVMYDKSLFETSYLKKEVKGSSVYDILKITDMTERKSTLLVAFNRKTGLIDYAKTPDEKNIIYYTNYSKFGNVQLPSTLTTFQGESLKSTLDTNQLIVDYPKKYTDIDGKGSNKEDSYLAYREALDCYKTDPVASLDLLNHSIACYPENIDAIMSRIMLNFSLENYEQVLDDCKKAEKIEPQNTDIYALEAYSTLRMKDIDETKNICNKILSIQKNNKHATKILEIINNQENHASINSGNKKATFWDVLNVVCNSLNAVSSQMNMANLNTSGATTVTGYSRQEAGSKMSQKKVVCSACSGTGKNKSKERPAFYNYNDENYTSGTCSVCGSSSNHYHKDCPSCLGRGYTYK